MLADADHEMGAQQQKALNVGRDAWSCCQHVARECALALAMMALLHLHNLTSAFSAHSAHHYAR